MFGRGSMDLCSGLICLCIIHWSSGETTIPEEQCNTTIRTRTKTEKRNRRYCISNESTQPTFTFQNGTNIDGTNTSKSLDGTNTSTSLDVGDYDDTMGLSDRVGAPGPELYVPVVVVCSLILVAIVLVGVICFRRRRKRRQKNNPRDTTEGPAELYYVEPEVIRERKRAGVPQDERNGTLNQSHSGINEFELTNRSTPFTEQSDDDDMKEMDPTYEVMEDDKVPVKNESTVQETNDETYINQSFQPAKNYDHVTIEQQRETSTDDVFENEAGTSESNAEVYDHIRKVHIT